jgi:hypothetical protein
MQINKRVERFVSVITERESVHLSVFVHGNRHNTTAFSLMLQCCTVHPI